MRKSPRIFGLFQLLQHHLNNHKLNERGFVFAELVIGLPLIVILLLSMNNIFVNSWTKCRYEFADFILQQEIESAMNRIVDDARIAYNVDISADKLRFYQHVMPAFNKLQNRDTGKPWYKLKNSKIYYNGESSPITGENILSGIAVRKFEYYQKPNHSKILYIKIEAESSFTHHRITLSTEVFMRGYNGE